MKFTGFFKSKIVQNAGWLMSGKVVHMVLSFVIGLVTARYLGPGDYGLINYASAYTTFLMSFCTLGINSVIVRNFISKPDEEGITLGTTFLLRILSTLLAMGVIASVVSIVDQGEKATKMVVILYSLALFFCCFDSYKQWFQAKLKSKYYAIATMISYSVVTVYKIILLISGKSVIWFAISNSIDYIIIAIMLHVFYKKSNGPQLSFSLHKAKELLSESCSYILSGLMIAIYGATDKFMLKQFLSQSEVGYYSLALSLSCIWTFVLSAFIESMVPGIMKYHTTDKEKYRKLNIRLYAMVFYISVFTSVVICIMAPVIIAILYGKEYLDSIMPLRDYYLYKKLVSKTIAGYFKRCLNEIFL